MTYPTYTAVATKTFPPKSLKLFQKFLKGTFGGEYNSRFGCDRCMLNTKMFV